MAISSKTFVAVLIMLLLLSTACSVQLPVPTRVRKLGAVAPAVITRHHSPGTGRSVLQVPVEANKEATSPGHSPSTGHGSPPGF
ncbi:hypothetical protein PVAP13_6KG338400 [Panicum virgatum]|uniref:Uncharacterized protein n=1 Tax=Panicum virgatum TaxID=38727 RepID=A0A8T0RH01_PANVG|nr:hypothetical protein PVAP13_6KG338400 [Panicum virgatum]